MANFSCKIDAKKIGTDEIKAQNKKKDILAHKIIIQK
jgi:hypothetical protein